MKEKGIKGRSTLLYTTVNIHMSGNCQYWLCSGVALGPGEVYTQKSHSVVLHALPEDDEKGRHEGVLHS